MQHIHYRVDDIDSFPKGTIYELQVSMPAVQRQHEAAPAAFRFNDLPEELQALIISSCLPEWSYILSRSVCSSCQKTLQGKYTWNRRAHHPKTKADSGAQDKSVYAPTSLSLTNGHFSRLAKAQSPRKFTGCVYVDQSLHNTKFHSLGQCNCQGSPGVLCDYNGADKAVTIIHDGTTSIIGFDLDLLLVLPNLKMVVAQYAGTIFDGYIQGFGNEKFFIRVVSEEKLKELMLFHFSGWPAQRRQKLEHLWWIGIRTVIEMKVTMGSPPTKFDFMCIFWLRNNSEPVVLGKFTMHEWEASVRLQMSVYNKVG